MYVNNIELDNNTLTDNDLDTCVTLGGSQGCITDKVNGGLMGCFVWDNKSAFQWDACRPQQ